MLWQAVPSFTVQGGSTLPIPSGSEGSTSQPSPLFILALAFHGWLVRHRYVLRNNRSTIGLIINYIVLLTIPILPLLIYVQWVATRSDPAGDDIDLKGVVFLLVAIYLFVLAAMHLLASWGDSAGAKGMAVWGGAVLAATTVYKLIPD